MRVSWLILLMSTATFAYETSHREPLDGSIFENAIERKCISNGQSKDQFRIALNRTYDCLKSSFNSEPPHPILNHQKFCKYLTENQFYGCIKNFTTDFLPCLDEAEHYLQQFILNAVRFGYNEICGSSGLSNLKYGDDKLNRNRECSYAVFIQIISGLCVEDLTFFKNLDKSIMNLNEKNVCLDLNSLRNCSTRTLESWCNNEDFSRFTDLYFQPFLEQCQKF